MIRRALRTIGAQCPLPWGYADQPKNSLPSTYPEAELNAAGAVLTGKEGLMQKYTALSRIATVSRCHYGSHKELKGHLYAFLMAYNPVSRLKTLQGKSPYDLIRNIWTLEPDRFIFDPNHFNMRLNT
jgi:hypothetical protein